MSPGVAISGAAAALRDGLQLRRGVPLPVCCGARLGSAVPGYEVEIEVLVTQRVLVGQLGSLHGGELRHGAGGSPAAFLPLQLSLSPTSAGCMQAALSQPGAGGGRTLRHGVGQPPLAVHPTGVQLRRAGFPPAVGVNVPGCAACSSPLHTPPTAHPTPQALGHRFREDAPPRMRGDSEPEGGGG